MLKISPAYLREFAASFIEPCDTQELLNATADAYEALAARLAEAERVITEARESLGDVAPINFMQDKKSCDALARFESAWVRLDNYHYQHLRAADSAADATAKAGLNTHERG